MGLCKEVVFGSVMDGHVVYLFPRWGIKRITMKLTSLSCWVSQTWIGTPTESFYMRHQKSYFLKLLIGYPVVVVALVWFYFSAGD
jgi:hypothetical protein